MNKKGQALVEFILVAPILIFIISGFIDIGNIIIKKYQLEDDITTVVKLYKQHNTNDLSKYLSTSNLTIAYQQEENKTHITVSKNVKVSTPLLNNILGSSYTITTKRVIYNE